MGQLTKVAAAVVASGTTWAQAKTGGLRIHLANLIATNLAKANPTTAATVNASGGGTTGGNLPAGAYYAAYSWSDGFGETLMGGETASSFSVTAGYIPQITIPSLPSNVLCANIYLTPVGGAKGSEVLYATGVTTTTFNMSYAPLPDNNPSQPPLNSTGAAINAQLVNAIVDPRASVLLSPIDRSFSNYLQGDPVSVREYQRLKFLAATVAKCWSTAIEELNTLIDANPGTAVGWSADGSPNGSISRTLP